MKKITNLILGIVFTAIIYFTAVLISHSFSLNNDFIPDSLITHSIMLFLSIIGIILFGKKSLLNFQFHKVKFKFYLYGFLITIAGVIISNILATIILSASGIGIDPTGKGHAGVAGMNSLQFFLFIFIYASICEEFLFRGFAQNFFQPLKTIRLHISKDVNISLPVILSGILFGLAHLILLNTETSGPMIFRIVLMTTFIGIIAGYFQEQHKNILPAIIIHMTANLPGLIMSLF